MSWLIVGTVPRDDFPLVHDQAIIDHDGLVVGEQRISISRGTPALTAATCMASSILGGEPPDVLLCGDTGRGGGSAQIYRYLVESGVVSFAHAAVIATGFLIDFDSVSSLTPSSRR